MGKQVTPTLISEQYKQGGTTQDALCIVDRKAGGWSIGNGQAHDAATPSYEVSKTLNCMVDPMKVMTDNNTNTVVRRLTPLECERLQGYPDHWTDIGEWIDSKGKKHKDADSPRYKALGNSIALPFWEWLAERMINELEEEHPTMASLFDGIGGFPLVFSRHGCEPVWASEIEEFPIAVTRIHFPERSDNDTTTQN